MASSNRLVSIEEAANLLQTYMPNRNARLWLLQDAQRNPIIPRTLLSGEPYYQMNDLAAFVIRFLNPTAQLGTERSEVRGRARRDRRHGEDRRINPPTVLAPGIERRSASQRDRRGSSQDRRVMH